MRRIPTFTAGLMLATGVSLALAGPVSAAAPSKPGNPCCGGSSYGQHREPAFGRDRGPAFDRHRGPAFDRDRGPAFDRHRYPAHQQNRQPGFGRPGLRQAGGLAGSIVNISIINQFFLNNVGNTTIGNGNTSTTGGIDSTNVVSQLGSNG